MLGAKRFLTTIQPRSLLSFGPDTERIELLSLNVLVGPNGSGKSNLVETIGLLQAASGNFLEPFQQGGGIGEWLWKGSETPVAEIDVTVDFPQGKMPLRHTLSFSKVGQRAELVDEAIENEHSQRLDDPDVYFYYRYQHGEPVINVRKDVAGSNQLPLTRRALRREDIPINQSVLSQRKDPDLYPEVTYLGVNYAKIRFFQEWNLGRSTEPRKPQPTDLPSDFLAPKAENLPLVLNDLEHRSGLRQDLVSKLQNADSAITDFSTKVLGGSIQLYLHYAGLKSPVPATRLSDGTIRYLCLLAILCHPEPPPLICIEEPELGLHPDLLPGLAELLVEASQRTQLIVTTHSDVLVDGLTSVPEAVLVCEKENGSTRMTRRTAKDLSRWLKEDYGLGQLWRSGEIGGNRW